MSYSVFFIRWWWCAFQQLLCVMAGAIETQGPPVDQLTPLTAQLLHSLVCLGSEGVGTYPSVGRGTALKGFAFLWPG